MNDYFKTFQSITQSAAQMTVDSSSIEIKLSAAKLKESVQPCFEELSQSANKLKELVKVSFAELEHAEDAWNSKPRIAQAPTLGILEQIGELSGYDIKINELGKKCKSQEIERAKESWYKRIEKLRQRWFIDQNGNLRKGVGWSDKEGFIKDVRPEVKEQLLGVSIIIKQSLSLVYQEITAINLELIQHCIDISNRQLQAELSIKLNLFAREIKYKFSEISEKMPEDFNGFSNTVNRALDVLINQGWGDIYWEQVAKFKQQVSTKIEEEINSVLDDRIELATKAIEEAIAFYNDFLEKQARYQLETLEQREAEKAWIDRQRQELEQVQKGIEAILN
jgi:hypothetical protein